MYFLRLILKICLIFFLICYFEVKLKNTKFLKNIYVILFIVVFFKFWFFSGLLL